MLQKRKKSRRDKVKNAALNKNYTLKIRHELMDQDYLDKLSPKEKDWLNRFNEEYIGANFTHEGKRLHPKKYKIKTIKSTGKKRKVDVLKQDCESKNNSRNRDSYSITKTNDMLKGEKIMNTHVESNQLKYKDEVEDNLIQIIDMKARLK